MKQNKNVVVIGGGTGTYTVLTGIKKIENINITAIVSSADSGGSTGVLRDHFGKLPVGDFRQCLVALAGDGNGDNILRDLFQYRFSKGGSGLEGHNFGNLLITALCDILGSEEKAFRKASKILNVRGRVFPVTYDDIQLVAKYSDGSIGYGEAMIDEPPPTHDGTLKIEQLWVQPKAKINLKAKEALEAAHYIILGPGDLYTSTLANIVISGVPKAIKKSDAKIVYISNLVSKYGQTDSFKVSDYIDEIEKYLDRKIDYILINGKKPSEKILRKYKVEKAHLIKDDMEKDPRAKRKNYLLDHEIARKREDKVKRSLLRHDSKKLEKAISKIISH